MIDQTSVTPEMAKRLEELSAKFSAKGQKLTDYLEGLLYADYLTYWDYIQLDTLLSLQKPKTDLKDEMIFVTYHQITELYFKLILWELEQLTDGSVADSNVFLDKVQRLNRYFRQLTNSFTIMTEGMEREQFAKFRMALMPASGFQSVQYRIIELLSTDLINLVHADYVLWLSPDDQVEAFLDKLYWKAGARDSQTGKKTLTLTQFEEEYDKLLLKKAKQYKAKNLHRRMQRFTKEASVQGDAVIQALRQYDQLANIHWPLAHFKAAVRYLVHDKGVSQATGGTNWRKYLPPRFQRVIFFPELWTEEEKDNWGKSWVLENVGKDKNS